MSAANEKYLIGLTGNIGTGKSVVRRMLGHLGAYGIDADALGHRAIMKGAPGYKPVVETFGRWILDSKGEIVRKNLAKIVFDNPAALKSLEGIVHPLVNKAIEIMVQRTPHNVVVIEAIKLIESGLADKCDAIWVTYTPEAVQIKRLCERRGMSEREALARIHAQPPQKEKISRADLVVVNDSSFEKVWKQVYNAWNNLSVNIPGEEETSAAQTKTVIDSSDLLRVERATPKQAEDIAALLNRIEEPLSPYTRMRIMEAFGEKAFLLLFDNMRNELMGVLSWQVENLVARVYDVWLMPEVPEAEAVLLMLKKVEAEAKLLQAEISMIFMPKESNLPLSLFPKLGYDRKNADELDSNAWYEAAKDRLGYGKLLFVKELRTDRVMKPL